MRSTTLRAHFWFCKIAVLVACTLGVATTAEAKILARWVQLGAGANAIVRVVTDGGCPQITFDGIATPMLVRSLPQSKFENVKPAMFRVTGCEALVPRGAIAGVIDGQPLPLPRPNPRRIVVFGDTGCRLLKGDPVQECNDPRAWPFPSVARAAAAAHPDLVIHVGDYLYRESPCPAANAGCAGSPSGYGWDSWNADFFEPAAPLLAAAPWVLVRGNHEDCNRAGEGWFRFLDHAPIETICRDFSGIFVTQLGGFGLVVVDGAKAADNVQRPNQVIDELRRQFNLIKGEIPGEAWLVTHRPLEAMRPGTKDAIGAVDNSIQDKAIGALVPDGVRMFVSGHIHFFQAVDFGGTRPPQLVVGTGGDNLEPIPAMSLAGLQINGRTVAASSAYSGFAYMVWDRTGNSWLGALFDIDGKPLDHCRLTGRSLTCGR
jgi:predicted phosphodiesterase